MPRRLLVAAVVAVVVAILAGVYVYLLSERRTQVQIVEAVALSETILLRVTSCRGRPTVTELKQDENEVQIAVESTTRIWGGGCDALDPVEVRLDAPLGDRVLVDASTGEEVAVEVLRG